ncbi:hypothetical protein CEXT_47421 [Caerostris extrusa]|uniref:Uncharacterized protein n=1 Tax=Caerostris extrusa TaxID=172846 RepID=A0AAV4VJV1_CAEEX|nr:hypothetical protein CEXT_47421 [Caerostris extrusa]
MHPWLLDIELHGYLVVGWIYSRLLVVLTVTCQWIACTYGYLEVDYMYSWLVGSSVYALTVNWKVACTHDYLSAVAFTYGYLEMDHKYS